MEIQAYINQNREIYEKLLIFIQSDDEQDHFNQLIEKINTYNIQKDWEELEQFLQLIVNISNNHHRKPDFFSKIMQILQFLKTDIQLYYTDLEIFEMFKNNKILLLLLIEEKLITIDSKIKISIESKGPFYYHYFLPELEKYESELENYEEYEMKRKQGENDSYISNLIRKDLVEDFISHVNRLNLPLSSELKPSIFETNSFLIEKDPTLIEYATFHGSIQIFQYLKNNNVEMNSNLWFYAIHSNNPEMIFLIEENQIKPPNDDNYISCFEESVKCHHNDIANYIKDNLMNVSENVFNCSIRYSNFQFFPEKIDNNYTFFYLCQYNYNKIVNIYLNNKEEEIKLEISAIYNASKDKKIDIIYYLLQSHKVLDHNIVIHLIDVLPIPPSITFIDNYACKNISFKQISIPSSVTCIGNYSFEFLGIKGIKIPSSVISIGEHAFSFCFKLKQIEIPYSVTSIGCCAFCYCEKLKKIELPPFLTVIESNLLCGCISLTEIIIPSSVVIIKSHAFSNCKSLIKVLIPLSVTEIWDYCFENCSSLKEISIPSSISSIDDYCFDHCSSLINIIIPSSVKSIGEYCFNGCSSLETITIPSSVTSIGDYCFKECLSLKTIKIPSSVVYFGDGAFSLCKSLKNVSLPSSLTSLDGTFNFCESLVEVVIPSSVTIIGDFAFDECHSLKHIDIHSKVTRICKYAFRNCLSLAQIVIPSSVTAIEKYAFEGCSSLKEVMISNKQTKINYDAFYECELLKNLPYYPDGTKVKGLLI